MRKLFNIIALSATVLLASCDMDKTQPGYADPENVFDNIQLIEQLERGAYSRLRNNYNAVSMIAADIQADYVHQIIGHRNSYGELYRGTFTQQSSEMETIWNTCYYTIVQCNYILDNTKLDEFDKYKNFSDADTERLLLIRGRMHLMRAMSYSMLAERYCADYDAVASKEPATGLPIVTGYDPAGKPSRSTLFDVYGLIVEDLDKAAELLEGTTGSANSIYLNMDCVTAMRAHVYLQMDMFPEALAEAKLIINNKKSIYDLAQNHQEFDDVWTYDRGKEVIFQCAASKTEGLVSYGAVLRSDYFSGSNAEENVIYWQAEFIPTKALLKKYQDNENDYRLKSWIHTVKNDNSDQVFFLTYNGKIVFPGCSMISKFPGNPNLRPSSGWNFANAWKVFRVAELYLIAAEAGIQTPGGEGDAKTYLNELRTHRGLEALNNVTFADVKTERFKEMIFEGTRIVDLKRWNEKMERPADSQIAVQLINGNTGAVEGNNVPLAVSVGRDLEMIVGDHRWLWPIPFSEMYANQNLAGQQNRGWE